MASAASNKLHCDVNLRESHEYLVHNYGEMARRNVM